jgi:hypothetical protein
MQNNPASEFNPRDLDHEIRADDCRQTRKLISAQKDLQDALAAYIDAETKQQYVWMRERSTMRNPHPDCRSKCPLKNELRDSTCDDCLSCVGCRNRASNFRNARCQDFDEALRVVAEMQAMIDLDGESLRIWIALNGRNQPKTKPADHDIRLDPPVPTFME